MKRDSRAGFALLLVFSMAAIVAITLFAVLPRVTFEAQRDKESLLIERGEQYKRAIQLYVRKFRRFPGRMEDLDNANGIRFLRHHYKDPLTGKDEWRLIHAGPGGVLIDSLISTKDKKKEAAQSAVSELPGAGGELESEGDVNIALRRRPSDQPGVPGSEFPGGGSNFAPGAPIPADPAPDTLPGSGLVAGNPYPGPPGQGLVDPATGLPVRIPPGALVPGNPNPPISPGAAAANTGISVSPAMGSVLPGVAPTGTPGFPPNFPPGVPQPGSLPPGIPQPGFPQPGFPRPSAGTVPTTNAQGSTEAARLIQGLLTTPRPGGLAGIQNTGSTNQTIGGGIAGVASTVKKGTGIKIYNDQDEYKKWEFVYDAAKDAQTAGGGAAQRPNAGQPGTGQPGAVQPGTGSASGFPQPGTFPGGTGVFGPPAPIPPPK